MFGTSRLFNRFTRTPREGGRKDVPMPEAQTTTVPPQPSTPAPAPEARDEVARQLSTLTEAMRQLAESHKTLLDAVKARPAPAPTPVTAPPADIRGEIAGGGQRPVTVLYYLRLSHGQ